MKSTYLVGDIIASADSPCSSADQFQARILWMDDSAMMPGREYLFKSNSQTSSMTLGRLKHRIDVNTLEELPAKVLDMNEIGVCNISLSSRIAFDPYDADPVMGGFVIIDRMTNNTVGMGLIDFACAEPTISTGNLWMSQSRAEQNRRVSALA